MINFLDINSQEDSFFSRVQYDCVYMVCIPCVRSIAETKQYVDESYRLWLHGCQHVYGDLYPGLSPCDRQELLEKCENRTCGKTIDVNYAFTALHAYRRSCDVFNIKEPSHTNIMIDGEDWEFDKRK